MVGRQEVEEEPHNNNKQQQQQNKEELKLLQKARVQCIQYDINLSSDHDIIWKERIQILAEITEKIYLLLDQQWLINTISEDISKVYRENGIKIWPHVNDLIHSRFKRAYNITTTSTTITTEPHQWGFLPEQSFTQDMPMYDVTHSIELIPTNQIAEICNTAKQIQQQCKKRAELEHIALMPDDNSSYTDQINTGKEHDRPQVTIDKPKPHGSLTYDALTNTIDNLTKVRDRVFEFPPEILEKDQEIAAGWETWNTWMSPSLDLKYSKSWLDWFKTEKYRDVYGKHAAAVMSFSLTNLCATCSDEKTREWVRMEPLYANSYASYQCLQCHYQIDSICPNCNLSMKAVVKPVIGWQCSECDGTVPLTRDLTREQVGDKSSIIIDAAIQVLDHIPSQVAFCAWYSDWIEPRIGGRKKRLGPDLSEKA